MGCPEAVRLPEMTQALEILQIPGQDLSAPDGPVRAVTGAVHDQADDRSGQPMFGHDRGHVSVVVLDGSERQAEALGMAR